MLIRIVTVSAHAANSWLISLSVFRYYGDPHRRYGSLSRSGVSVMSTIYL